MATSPTITNRILIRADALNSDSPKNALTSREISVKQRDDVDFAIALSNAGQKIPADEIARICVEIFDIGARNPPRARQNCCFQRIPKTYRTSRKPAIATQ